MAAPSYITASTGSTDASGAWTHTSAAPGAAGRVLIVQVLQDGTNAGIPNITSVTNAENLAGTANVLTKIGQFDVGSAVAAFQHLWIGRSLSTSAMVITGSNSGGDDVYVRVYEFSDVSTGTTLATVIENGTAGATVNNAGTSNTAADLAMTTLGPDRMGLDFLAINDDNAAGSMLTGSPPGGEGWITAATYASATGTDGSINLYRSFAIAAAGTGTASTANIVDSDAWGVVGFALIGTTAATALPPTRDPWPALQAVNRSNVY